MAEISIVIKDGKVNIEAHGVQGASCTELTSILEKELGVVEEDHLKPQYYNELDELSIELHEEE